MALKELLINIEVPISESIPEPTQVNVTAEKVLAGITFRGNTKTVQTGTLVIPDISDTTATVEDVAEGKVFYNAAGERVVGTHI